MSSYISDFIFEGFVEREFQICSNSLTFLGQCLLDEAFSRASAGWYGLIKFLTVVSSRSEGLLREHLHRFKLYPVEVSGRQSYLLSVSFPSEPASLCLGGACENMCFPLLFFIQEKPFVPQP